MKNNKGFTLAEIVAVLVVLSLIMIIAIPSVQKALQNSKQGISELNKKNLKEAAELLVEEVLFCDDQAISIITKHYPDVKTCDEAKEQLNGGIKKITVEDLKTNGYFTDSQNKCSGIVHIQANTKGEANYAVAVNLDQVTCK